MVQFIKHYESDKLFKRHDLTTIGMRRHLGWEPPGLSNLSPEDSAKLRAIDLSVEITKDAWDNLCSLFTAYRLVDAFVAYGYDAKTLSFTHGVPQSSLNELRRGSTLTENNIKKFRV